MSERKIFGYSEAEVRRQCEADTTAKSTDFGPIKKFQTVEPCIEGGKKILADSDTTEMLRKIYLGQ